MSSKDPSISKVSIRQAVPDDAPAAARLIHLSGPGIHDCMYGGEVETGMRVIETVFRSPGALFSFENTKMAEIEGQVRGVLVTYDRKAETEQGKRYFKAVFRALPKRRYVRMFLHMMGMRLLVRGIRPGSLYGGSIAVFERAQGSGIGLAMLHECMRQVEKRGYERFEADMEIDNTKAWRVYEKYGFKKIGTRVAGPMASFLGLQGFHRIEITLAEYQSRK
jgi:ribosomal protein S18 acetylase RimI-like enzyme